MTGAEQHAINTQPPNLVAGTARLVQACALLALAYLLNALDSSGTFLYLGAGIGTGQLILAAMAGAWFFFLGSSLALVPALSRLFRRTYLRWTAGFLGGTATCAWLILLAGYGFLAYVGSGAGYERISAPEGGHTLLIVNRSFLLLGTHAVYEQRQGPVYEYRDSVLTDDGYDPFGPGAFSVRWDPDTATMSFAPSAEGEDGTAGNRTGRAIIPLEPK